VQGRLAAKSTMMETRAWRLIQMQELNGSLPVLLNYYGAKTGRWSGGNKVNFQNMPTSTKDYPMAGELRKSILAPPGHVIIAPDSAQIEARVVAWVSGHEELLDRFRNQEDVYKWMASLIYGVPVEEIDAEQRFIGKIAVLGLGYAMGAKRFQTTLAMGVMGPPMMLTMLECNRIVKMYRKINQRIVQFWAECENVMEAMCAGKSGSFGPNGILEYDGTDIWLPNGMGLHYPGLRMTWDAERERRSGFSYDSAGIKKHIYGGLLCENIVQALAGVVIREEMTEVDDLYAGLKLRKGEIAKIATMTHDEIVSVIPLRIAPQMLKANLKIMRTAPAWAPDMPIWAAAEGGHAVNYSV
jgi:DNA polymerase